jgi:hypothetical protein
LAVETEILGSEVVTEDPIINSGAIGEGGGLDTIPKGRSIAHIIFDNQNAVFLLFDIETAGEIAGIVQIFSLKRTNEPLSAQLFPQIRRHVRIMTFHF